MSKGIRRFSLGVLFLVTVIIVSGCATRKYVRHEIGQEIGTIEPQVTEVRNTQAQQAERIDALDRRAQEGLTAANRAAMAAETANERATAADRRAADAERRADTAQVNAQRALNQIDTVEKQIEGKLANLDKYSVADRSTVTFKFDSDVLSKDAISKLDDIAGWVSGAPSGYFIELQGFTDSIGPEKYNFGLSQRRAESVLRYLVSKGVPLHRISIVGLGKRSPVADNKTAGGREQNRRVEVRVLRSGSTVATANR
jgi:outer membrane protein OmpA-like peptidoglycan-associated protein